MSVYYQYPNDDLARTLSVTPTVTLGTVDTDYPIANLGDDNLAHPTKFSAAASGFRVVYDLGSAIAVRFACLLNTNLDAGISLILYSSADNFSTIAETYAFPTLLGVADDDFSIDPYLASELVSSTPRRYWRVDCDTNSVLPAIGRIWLSGTLRTLESSPLLTSYQPTEGHGVITHRTNLGVTLAYAFGTRLPEGLTGTLRTSAATGLPAIRAWERQCLGPAMAVPVVPDSTRNEARFMRFAEGYQVQPTYLGPALVDVPVAWTDVSRGLAL